MFFEWGVTAFIIFCSSVLQSMTGFGFSIMAIPFLSLIMDPHRAIPLVMLVSFCTLAMNIRSVWSIADKQLLRTLLIGSLLGLPIGAYVYFYLEIAKLKLFISVSIITITLLLVIQKWIVKWLRMISDKAMLFGTISGFLTLSVGMPGPPIVLYLVATDRQPREFRALSLTFLFLIYPITLTVFALSKSISMELIGHVLFLLPFSWVGISLGNIMHHRLSPEAFRRVTLFLIIATGLYSLVQSI